MSTPRPTTRAEAKARQNSGGRPRRWLKRLGLTALGVAVLGIIGFAIAYAVTPVPEPNDLADAQASIIYFDDGKTELDRISQVNRESVPLAQVPKMVQQAHLAAEDRNFYENSGISPTGIARGAWATIRGGTTQSGSTITQQYVKNYFLTQDQTISRKAKEILISIKVNKQESKDQILEDYLNTIYYGRGAYGIQTAARAYFNKDVSKLTAGEGALLASVIKGPTFFDPGLGAEQAKNARARWDYVLDGMEAESWITQAQRSSTPFPKTVKYSGARGSTGSNGYITQEVKKELKAKLKLTDADIDKGGYRIVTTINKRSQDAAVAAVKDRMPTGKGTEHLQAGLVSIQPGNGAIRAMYGGRDYQKNQFNAATQATMQGGSTFKVFTLIAALQKEISTKTRFNGQSPQFFEEFADAEDPRGRVRNFSNQDYGRIDLRKATASSVNTVFAQLNVEVGPKETRKAALTAGIPANTPGLGDNYSNVFGTASPRVIDMANAYATIAAKGVRSTPYLIQSVKGGAGGLDYKAKPATRPVFDKDVMADVTDAMTRVVREGSGEYAQNLSRPVAGKTGTTTENRAVWFDGFVPQLATAVAIYNDVNGTPQPMKNIDGFGELTGGSIPVRIWTDYMEVALKGKEVIDFPERAGVGDDEVYTPPPPPSSASSSSSSSTTTTTKPTTTTSAPPTTTVEPPPTSETSKPTKPPRTTITVPLGGQTATP